MCVLKKKEAFPLSCILSTETDVNIRQAKAWTAFDRLFIMQKSDISDKIKRDFFQAVDVAILLHGCTPGTPAKCTEKG